MSMVLTRRAGLPSFHSSVGMPGRACGAGPAVGRPDRKSAYRRSSRGGAQAVRLVYPPSIPGRARPSRSALVWFVRMTRMGADCAHVFVAGSNTSAFVGAGTVEELPTSPPAIRSAPIGYELCSRSLLKWSMSCMSGNSVQAFVAGLSNISAFEVGRQSPARLRRRRVSPSRPSRGPGRSAGAPRSVASGSTACSAPR